jgi:undecaprenyl-diphosphatase
MDTVVIFFANYLIYIVGAVFVVFFLIKKTRAMAISTALTVFLSRLIITEPLKRILNVTRPNGEPFSFPSGHTTVFFAIAMAVFYFNKKWGIIAFVVAILVGLSRVYTGVHWPLDIVAGALIGILSGIIIHFTRLSLVKSKNKSVEA